MHCTTLHPVACVKLQACPKGWFSTPSRTTIWVWAEKPISPGLMIKPKKGGVPDGRSMVMSLELTRRKMQFETKIKSSQRPKNYINKPWIFGLSRLEHTTTNWQQGWLLSSFTADPENGFQHYKTVPGCLSPSHDMVKAFIRWYADSTNGRLDKSRKLIVRTTKACAERFFGGFREVTKTEVPETDRKEIYSISSRLSLF